jgi:hypothetical protein
MTKKSPNIVAATPDRVAEAIAWMTPERRAALDAMTDEDIAAQIAGNPDAAPELTDEWFENAQLVIPMNDRRSLTAVAVRFDDAQMWVDLEDGRTLGIPLVWYPRLRDASPEARSQVSISASGLHWEELDEDISIAGLLAGRGDMTRAGKRVA